MKTNAQMGSTAVMLMQSVKIYQDHSIAFVNQDTLVMGQLVKVFSTVFSHLFNPIQYGLFQKR